MLDPASVQGAIFWGIVSGLATSVLLVLAGLFISKIVLPGYLDFVYRGVDLRGVWTYEAPTAPAGRFVAQLSLAQKANKVSGTATINQSGTAAADYVQFFTVEGSTWEGFLMLNLRSTNRKSLSFVAALFKITGRGQLLEGHWVYRSASTDTAASEPLNFIRQAKP